jgi:hypothetical protein
MLALGPDLLIRNHILSGLYPEHIEYQGEARKAVVLCARGEVDCPLEVNGAPMSARFLVAAFRLERFVDARVSAPLN